MQNKPSRLFFFAGANGTGKSTVAQNVAFVLRDAGENVLLVQEPGTTVFGKAFREVMNKTESAVAKAMAHAAARRELYERYVLPHLGAGGIVISDRSYYCFFAYHLDYVPLSILLWLNDLACFKQLPLGVICCTASYSIAKKRRLGVLSFPTEEEYQRICDNYDNQLLMGHSIWCKLDTGYLSVSETTDLAVDFINERLKNK